MNAHLLLTSLVASLQAQYAMYQEAHWLVKGDSFYGKHLMFQRIYEALPEQTDTLAEKIVGNFGDLDKDLLSHFRFQWSQRWTKSCPVERGLDSERDVRAMIQYAYKALESEGTMTMGFDDFLMSLDSEHETNVYLLQRSLLDV